MSPPSFCIVFFWRLKSVATVLFIEQVIKTYEDKDE